MSPWPFNVYMDEVMKELKMEMGRNGVRFQEEGREWRLSGLLYADGLVLCGESEENLRAIVECFIEMCMRKGLKFNAGKSKVMMLGGEEGLECDVCINGYVWSISRNLKTWDVFQTNQVQMRQSVVGRWRVGGRRVIGTIRSLVNDSSLELDCAGVLHESLLVSVLTLGSETMIWREKERSRIWDVQMDNLRCLLGIYHENG